MTGCDSYITLPNFLIPYRDGGVEDYTDAPETVGKIVIAVASKLFRGADVSESLSPCERGVYRHWLKVAEDGLEKAGRERAKMQKAAAARWGNATGGGIGRGAAAGTGTPAPVAPVRRTVPAQPQPPAPNQSGTARRGGVKQLGGVMFDPLAMFQGGEDFAGRLARDPVKVALELTRETGNKFAENSFAKYLREKGAAAFCDEVLAFASEIKQGEEPRNRGQTLNARLNKLPSISARG